MYLLFRLLDCANPPCRTVLDDSLSLLRTLHTVYIWPLLTVVASLFLLWMLSCLWRQAKWDSIHKIMSLAYLVVLDLQLLLGIVLWIAQQRWTGLDALRSFEHPLNMIIAMVIYHVGYARLKRDIPDRSRFVSAVIWGAACLVVFGLGIVRIKYL